MPVKITPTATLIRVQELHDAGNSFRKVAEILAAEGVPPAGPRSLWHHQNVRWCLEQVEQRSASSATWGLSPQIRARLAAQGEEIEGLTVAGVQRVGAGIQAAVRAELQKTQTETTRHISIVKRELETLQYAAESQTKFLRGALGRLSLWLVGGAMALGLGVSGVAWAAGEWMESSLKGYQAEIAQAEARQATAEARQATAEALVVELENKTGGLGYVENEAGRFLIWRKGDEPHKNTRGQWVVKLKGK